MVNCLYGPILIRRTTRVSLGPLLFLIYISDLSEDLTTNTRLFADDVSFFSVVDINLSATKLNSDLMENRQLNGEQFSTLIPTNMHKRYFFFFRKIKKTSQLLLNFNNNSVNQVKFQKHKAFIWMVNWTFVNIFFKTCLRGKKNNQLVT